MITHDSALDDAYGRYAWEPVCEVDFYSPAGVLLSTVDTVADGYLDTTSDRWPRQEATIMVPASLTPQLTASPVSPFGGRVVIRMGARLGLVDYVFQVADLDVVEDEIVRPDGLVMVRAVSHEARVNEDRYETRTSTASGSSSSVITTLVRRTLGGSWPVTNTLTSDPTLAAGAFPLDGDVWPTVEAIADAAGGEAVFGADGTLLLRDAPTVDTPAMTFRTGEDPSLPGTIVGYRSRRGWAPNRVAVVYEEATGATPGRVVGLWEDTSGGDTDVAGDYGRHTRVDRVSVDAGSLPSSGAADAAAAAIGLRAQGDIRSVVMNVLPAPWLEVGDTVTTVLLGETTDDVIVTRTRIPLTQLEPMTVEARDPQYTA